LSVSVLLGTLRERGVELRAEGERLRCLAPDGALTPELAAQIRAHKAELLALLSAAPSRTAAVSTGLPRVATRDRYPLSFTQQRNLYAALSGPGLPTAFRLKGPLDRSLLEASLEALVARHAPLRSRFNLHGEEPQQLVVPSVAVSVGFDDFAPLGEGREEALAARLRSLAQQRFDLEQGPLFRFHLFRLDELEHALFIAFSQMVFDGWSFDVFLNELREGYAALASGRPWPFGELEAEFVDYVAWQRARVAERGGDQFKFWRDRLGEEVPAGVLPTDHPRPKVATYQGGAVPFALPGALGAGLRELAKRHGSTLQMVMMTALFGFLARVGTSRDVLVATPIEGRTHPATERLVGAFVNLLLLRSLVDPARSFVELLAHVRDVCLAAYDHQDLPIDQLNLRVRRAEETGFVPLWQVEFSYQEVSRRGTLMGPLALDQIEVHAGGAPNELAFWVKDNGVRVSGAVEFARDLFTRETVEHWRDCYIAWLGALHADPELPIARLDLLGPQRERVELATRAALTSAPAWLPAARSTGSTAEARVVDGEGQLLPLGAFGTLVLPGEGPGSRIADVRVTTTGRLQRKQDLRATARTERDASQASHLHESPGRRRKGQAVADAVEFRLIEEYSALLGVAGIGLDSNFFDLGGHSLVAVRLLDRVQREFGARLALGALFEAPTPYELAKLVRTEAGLPDPDTGVAEKAALKRWSSVVPIQKSGSLPPFFAAAGVGGNPMNLRFLAKHLGPDQPFYGLQHRGTDGRSPPHTSVASMVEEYYEHVREVQPTGPYYLGGFSAGGIAVFELARRLLRAGERTGLVVMFDANSVLVRRLNAEQKRAAHLERLREQGLQYVSDVVRGRIADRLNYARLRGAAALARWYPYRFRNEAVTMAWLRALYAYSPTTYAGDVLVLRAKERDNWTFDPTNGWAELVEGRLEVVEVDGGHTTHVNDRFAPTTANALRQALAAARERQRTA
jgi:thioesterase domain-containing protein/acyl carrier protein